jgi:DNA-binding protein H-NS
MPRKKQMTDNQDADDIEEGRLPPSDITRLARMDDPDIDLRNLTPDALLSIIKESLKYLPVEELLIVRDLAEQQRQEHFAEEREALVRDFQEKLARMGSSFEDVLTQYAPSGGGRRKRSDTGRPLPIRYRGPNGETWSGRGHPPRWIQHYEDQGREGRISGI